jgi:hypothetical protein
MNAAERRDFMRQAAVRAGRAARNRQSLPLKVQDPVLIGKLVTLWREGGRDDE